jgi:hypothetical protein
VLVPVEPAPVITTFVLVSLPALVDFAAPVLVPVSEVFPPVLVAVSEFFPPVFVACVAVDMLGSPVAAADCADAPIARTDTTRVAERSGDFRRSLMVYVLSGYCAKETKVSEDECERPRDVVAVRRGRNPSTVCLLADCND